MLKNLRDKKTAKKIWIILAILILPAFVLWGSGSIVRNQEERSYVGKINNKKISFLDYRDSIEATRNQAIMQFGDNFSEVQKYLKLEEEAWERLILLNEAKRRRIKVSDKEVIKLIQSYPFFQKKGKFDNQTYLQLLQYVFRTPARNFEEEIRENLMLSKLYAQNTDEIKISDEETLDAYRKLNEEISLNYIAALYTDFIKEADPSVEELKKYFEENSLQFKEPLSFNIEYLTGENEETIKKIALQIRSKKQKDLSGIAKEFGLQTKETGLFRQTDLIPGLGYSAPIMGLLAKMNPGQVSPIISTDKQYLIFKLKERKEPYIPDFDQIKERVKENFIENQSKKIGKGKIEELEKELKTDQNISYADFQKLAKKYGLKAGVTVMFKYNSYIEGIGPAEDLWDAALNLQGGKASRIITMPSGYYIISLKSKTPIDEVKFQSEKEELSQKSLAQKKQKQFLKFVAELKTKAQLF